MKNIPWANPLFDKKEFNQIKKFIEPSELENFILSNKIKIIFHLGAISSTTFEDNNILWMNNTIFSVNLWRLCSKKKIKLIVPVYN